MPDMPDPIHDAAMRGDVAKVQAGLQAGVNPDLRGGPGYTALHYAAMYGHAAVVGVLVGGGAAVGAEDWNGRIALHEAAIYGHAAVVEALVGAGAGVDAVTKFGETPLSLAATMGKTEAAAALLDAGADATRHTDQGKTSAEWARENGHAAVMQLIEAHYADTTVYAAEQDHLIQQMQHADEVHVISTPWGGNEHNPNVPPANKRGSDKAKELKKLLTKERVSKKSADSQFEVFCFNTNEDIGTIAGRTGWDEAKQERKWLQVYNAVLCVAQQKNKRTVCGMFSALCCRASLCKGTMGTVHILWNRSNGDPPQSTEAAVAAARDDHPALVGNAQAGELFGALLAGFSVEDGTLVFACFECEEAEGAPQARP